MHIFGQLSIGTTDLLREADLHKYVMAAKRIATTPEAIKAFEVGNYKNYQSLSGKKVIDWSPHYFGAAIEFLAECFFEMFGAEYNLYDIKSVDDVDAKENDTGVDHYAKTINRKMSKDKLRESRPGSMVFIQTKGTTRRDKVYTTNDGSRLPNFYMNAQSQAIARGQAYQARYILFTTGKGLHYTLDKNSGNKTEIVNFNKIAKRINNNELFFNLMRKKCGLPEVDLKVMDVEARLIRTVAD